MNNLKEKSKEILKSIGVEIGYVDAYGWATTNFASVNYKESNSKSGWWNENYNLGSFFTKVQSGVFVINKIAERFKKEKNWKVEINNNYLGYCVNLSYCEMSEEESNLKAFNNLVNGGRMSD